MFLYSYEAEFITVFLLLTGKKRLASRFNLIFRHIDDVLSIYSPEFENYMDKMYPAEVKYLCKSAQCSVLTRHLTFIRQ